MIDSSGHLHPRRWHLQEREWNGKLYVPGLVECDTYKGNHWGSLSQGLEKEDVGRYCLVKYVDLKATFEYF